MSQLAVVEEVKPKLLRIHEKLEVPPEYALTDLERKLLHAVQYLLIHDGYNTVIDKQRERRVKKLKGKR